MALGVEERGGELDFEGSGGLDEVDDGGGLDGLVGHQLGGGGAEFGAGGDGVLAGRGVFDQGGRGFDLAEEGVGEAGVEVLATGWVGDGEGRGLVAEDLAGGVADVPGGLGGGGAELLAERANLGELAGEQAGDLGFEGAGVDDLAERGVGGEREQVAGEVEGAGLEGAGVGLVLHPGGLGDGALEGVEHPGADGVVGGEEGFDGGGVAGGPGGCVRAGELGRVPAGLAEVLVAGGALLAVPALFVDQRDRGE